MLKAQTTRQTGLSCTRERIVQAAIRLYREIGYRKTTVADVARDASMSPANLYRFYPSRRALEEAVVTELLDEVLAAAASAARSGRSGLERLNATFGAISRLHEDRLANDVRLHELVVAAGQANWLASLSHADRLRGVVRSIIAAAQPLPCQGDRPSANVRRDDALLRGGALQRRVRWPGAPSTHQRSGQYALQTRLLNPTLDWLTASSLPHRPQGRSRRVRA